MLCQPKTRFLFFFFFFTISPVGWRRIKRTAKKPFINSVESKIQQKKKKKKKKKKKWNQENIFLQLRAQEKIFTAYTRSISHCIAIHCGTHRPHSYKIRLLWLCSTHFFFVFISFFSFFFLCSLSGNVRSIWKKNLDLLLAKCEAKKKKISLHFVSISFFAFQKLGASCYGFIKFLFLFCFCLFCFFFFCFSILKIASLA